MRKKTGRAMVVGAGISGIKSALDLAETGYRVTLVEKAPHIGGILSQLDYQFPSDGCGMCRMLPLIERDAGSQYCLRKGLFHENIDILLGARVTALEGEPGAFKTVIEQKPSWIDADRCIGCGQCAQACPVMVDDGFNLGLGSRKAVFLPVPHNIPNTYTIDFANCTRCGECVKACPTQAIHFPEERRKNFHILVVDDELIVRDSLKEWLADEGFSVDMADSGQAALDMLAQKTYHLMLTDIKMPGMDGVTVLESALKDYPDLTVVMMTAYATVETAVEAMKIGALDYLLKPFDPKVFTPKILEIYQSLDVTEQRQIDVNTIIFTTGTQYFDPKTSKNTFGYGVYPDVVTSREFERLISGTGPTSGQLLRRSDQGAVKKIAWFQCVGSRDFQTDSDFCSSVCCMHAVKEARLVKEKYGHEIETVIFYMDMRAFGKHFQQYLDEAKTDYGVRFEKSRVHTVIENREGPGLKVSYFDHSGKTCETVFDMVVLSVGQRPSDGVSDLARLADIKRNAWGFCEPEPFLAAHSGADGIFVGGSYTGLKDIAESVIHSSAAALCASKFMHEKGRGISADTEEKESFRDVSRENPRILVMMCRCDGTEFDDEKGAVLKAALLKEPAVDDVMMIDKVCTQQGWDDLTEKVVKSDANRILISACMPYAYTRKIRELSEKSGLHPALIDVMEMDLFYSRPDKSENGPDAVEPARQKLMTGISRLKRIDPPVLNTVPTVQRALVVGGGAAGMTAALSIADHGFEVDLVEKDQDLGGNLSWLRQTIEGREIASFLDEMKKRVNAHPRLTVHFQSKVTASFGRPGHFITTIEKQDADTPVSLEHGAVILATGGTVGETKAYGYGNSPLVVNHKDLEQGLSDGKINPGELDTVVMIQCVDSRQASQKNYCSRVCCTSTLKYARALKKENPDLNIYVFYRDMMAYGFFESYYTKARQEGIIFIRYDLDHNPEAVPQDNAVTVKALEPVLGQPIEIEADLLVLATGVTPVLPDDLTAHFGVEKDDLGFFKEADSKWRPVDALKEGIFTCGLCHSPRNITETIASAQAAAQRALRILGQPEVVTSVMVAHVHESLCSLCERCIETCPYGARSLDPDGKKVMVNPMMCQGCGACAAVCPNSASSLNGFKDQQIFDVIESVF